MNVLLIALAALYVVSSLAAGLLAVGLGYALAR